MSDRKSDRYLTPCRDSRWAIGREIAGRWIHLIQDTPVDEKRDVPLVLSALNIPLTLRNKDRYFPHRNDQENRCPTIDLLELFAHLGTVAKEVGV